MKIIYTTHLASTPQKVVVTDYNEELVREAKERVLKLAGERPWWPSIEISLRDFKTLNEIEHTHFKIRVENIVKDDAQTILSDLMAGRERPSSIHIDLGHYCFEGWMSAIEGKDLLELPEVWFESTIINHLIEPISFSFDPEAEVKKATWDIVEEGHRKELTSAILATAKERSKLYHEQDRHLVPHMEAISVCCVEVLEGRKSFEELKQICEYDVETETRHGKERE